MRAFSPAQCVRPFATRRTRDEQELGSRIEDELDLRDDVEEAGSQGYGNDGMNVELSYSSDRGGDYADLTPSDVRPPFQNAFAVPDGDVRTHRVRSHGNRSLPLSPVIDPVCVAARNRWKMKKALPPAPDEMTPFQKELAMNVYGMF